MATNLRIPKHLGTLRSTATAPVIIPGNAFHYPLSSNLADAFEGRAAALTSAGGLANADGLSVNSGWYTFPLSNTATLATAHWITQGTPDAYAASVLTLKGPGGLMPVNTTILVGIDFQYSGDVPTSEETLWSIGAAEGNAGYMSVTVSALQLLRFNFKLANAGAESGVGTIDLSGITGRISITVELQAISTGDVAVRMRAKHAGGTLSADLSVAVLGSEAPILTSAASYWGLSLGARASASGPTSNPRAVLGKAGTGARSRLANFYARRLTSYDSGLLATVLNEQYATPNVFPASLRVA